MCLFVVVLNTCISSALSVLELGDPGGKGVMYDHMPGCYITRIPWCILCQKRKGSNRVILIPWIGTV